MSKRKPLVVVTRKLPDVVETRMMELFQARLNETDAPMTKAQLIEGVNDEIALLAALGDGFSRDHIHTRRRLQPRQAEPAASVLSRFSRRRSAVSDLDTNVLPAHGLAEYFICSVPSL